MSDYPPPGKIWFCMMCGKKAPRLSSEEGGWDESCSMNCIAINSDQNGPTLQQADEFHKGREESLARCFANIDASRPSSGLAGSRLSRSRLPPCNSPERIER